MEDELDYQKAAAAVDSIDANAGGESLPIDIAEVFANRLEVKKVRYAELSPMLDKLEMKKGETLPEAPAQAKQQQKPQQPQALRHELSKEMVSAAARLRSMAGGVGREFEGGVVRRIEEAEQAKLVMPTLSLQDQLSDLEKIKEGLGEGVFNKEQLKIIAQEVKGLSSLAAREDQSKLSDDQRELALMRNQRVKEIKTGLNMN